MRFLYTFTVLHPQMFNESPQEESDVDVTGTWIHFFVLSRKAVKP